MFGSDVGSVVGGLINSGRGLPTMDLSALFSTISKAGAKEQDLINGLPDSMKPLYENYKASLGAAGTTLQGSTAKIGQSLLEQTKALYGPNSPAVQATLAALKQQDYSTLPGTLTNLRAQLAATGGLARGGANKALTTAVLAPAAQYSQQAATVTGQQLTTQQQNVQAALNRIASLDEQTAQSLFGMSKEQAQQILTTGRQDLQDQLASLINQSRTQTSQTLGVEGIQANQAYQNAVTRNQQQAAITNGLVNLGVEAATNFAMPGADEGLPAGADVSSNAYMRNALKNAPK